MFDFLITLSIETVTFNSIMGFLLYWIPLLFCVVGYTIRTFKNYRKDIKERLNSKSYCPTDTIGNLIGRAIVSIIPIANIWASVFSLAPDIFSSLFKYIEKVFDQPLVPRRKDK